MGANAPTMDRPIPIAELLSHAGWLRRLATALVGEGRADDLVQDTWIAAMSRPPRGGAAARPWLARVAINLAHNARRSAGRRKKREAAADEREPLAGPERAAAEAEAQRLLADAVARLDEPLRTVIVLRYFRERRPHTIARELGLPTTTVSGRLQRALAALRTDLRLLHGEERDRWALALLPLLRARDTGPAAVGTAALWTGAAALVVAGAIAVALEQSQAGDVQTASGGASFSASSVTTTETNAAPRLQAGRRSAAPVESDEAHRNAARGADVARSEAPRAEISGRVLVDGVAPTHRIELHFQREETGDAVKVVWTTEDGAFVEIVDPEWSGVLFPEPNHELEDGEVSMPLLRPTTGLVVRLRELPSVRGRVVGPDGRHLSQVAVSYAFRTYEGGRQNGDGNGAVACDDLGSFRIALRHGEEADIRLLLRADGGRRYLEIERFERLAGKDLGDLLLEPAVRVGYRLLDPDGRPIPDGRARMEDTSVIDALVYTNEDGRGELVSMPTGGARVRFGAPGFSDRVLEVHPGEEPRVILEPVGRLDVQLRDCEAAALVNLRVLVRAEERIFEDTTNLGFGDLPLWSTPTYLPDLPGPRAMTYAPDELGHLVLADLRPDVPFVIEVQEPFGRVLWTQDLALGAREWRRLEPELRR